MFNNQLSNNNGLHHQQELFNHLGNQVTAKLLQFSDNHQLIWEKNQKQNQFLKNQLDQSKIRVTHSTH